MLYRIIGEPLGEIFHLTILETANRDAAVAVAEMVARTGSFEPHSVKVLKANQDQAKRDFWQTEWPG